MTPDRLVEIRECLADVAWYMHPEHDAVDTLAHEYVPDLIEALCIAINALREIAGADSDLSMLDASMWAGDALSEIEGD